MTNKFGILFILFSFIAFSCDDSGSDISSNEPSNLVVDIVLSEDTRDVSITATADNVVEYQFNLGDGSDAVTNSTGMLEYTYAEGGNYSLEIKAFGSSGKFIRETKTISIEDPDLSGPIDDTGYTSPLSYNGMSLIWNDEFEGSALNETYWNYEIGTGSGGWGNNELQYYREDNTSMREGYLLIEARRESFSGSQYTSSRLTTEGKFDFKYGRVDIRAKMPKGQGLWPALWMLGANFRSVGWPYCGEIDIMEMIGGTNNEDVVHGTAHWDASGTKADFGGSTRLSSGILNDEFHVFTIIWDETQIRWLFDDRQYHAMSITPADLSEFQEEFFFIFNVAVGGNWPGSPNSSTIFPQRMIVDYVRVFQENN
ncbi:glycoside hydrolase family 16 protein [Ekhidna sp.]|uniref:glycoside hydrolase family 16 protein n=1 Tax=Ekhidna sp. TaxID=2608089 RepID=UPI00329A40E2